MPVEQRDPRQTIKAVSLGIAAVAAAVGFLIFVLWVTDRGGVEIALGDDVFEAGRADIIAREIAEDGPIKYGDLIGGSQNIILQHVGAGSGDRLVRLRPDPAGPAARVPARVGRRGLRVPRQL